MCAADVMRAVSPSPLIFEKNQILFIETIRRSTERKPEKSVNGRQTKIKSTILFVGACARRRRHRCYNKSNVINNIHIYIGSISKLEIDLIL